MKIFTKSVNIGSFTNKLKPALVTPVYRKRTAITKKAIEV